MNRDVAPFTLGAKLVTLSLSKRDGSRKAPFRSRNASFDKLRTLVSGGNRRKLSLSYLAPELKCTLAAGSTRFCGNPGHLTTVFLAYARQDILHRGFPVAKFGSRNKDVTPA